MTACRLERSLVWLQDVAGLRRHGLRARLARRALGLAYARTLQVWFEDEGADLGRTMAELDKQLRRVQRIAGLREPRARRAEEARSRPTRVKRSAGAGGQERWPSRHSRTTSPTSPR